MAIRRLENFMPHPNGSAGNPLTVIHTFADAYSDVGSREIEYLSTTGAPLTATQGLAGDGVTPTIVLRGQNYVHGRVCASCWGFMTSCTGERIGQAVSTLDEVIR
jgi:hypothetical protein